MGEEFIDKEYCRSIFFTIYKNFPDDNSSDTIHCKAIAWTLATNPTLFDENNEATSCFDDISHVYKLWDKENDNQKKFKLFNDIRSKISYLYSLFFGYSDLYKQQIFIVKYQEKFNELIQEKIRTIYPELQTTNSKVTAINNKLSKLEQIDIFKERKKTNEFLGYLEKAKETAEITIGDIADNKNAGKYKEYYESCRKSASWLFWSSLTIMAVVSGIVVCHLWNIDTIDTTKILIRFPLAFLVLMPSFFMMREAKKLKDKEFQYYDMMCRIVTSAPYIDGLTHLDDNQKDRMKADLVKDFFARPIECRDDGGLVPIEEICKIIKACLGEK